MFNHLKFRPLTQLITATAMSSDYRRGSLNWLSDIFAEITFSLFFLPLLIFLAVSLHPLHTFAVDNNLAGGNLLTPSHHHSYPLDTDLEINESGEGTHGSTRNFEVVLASRRYQHILNQSIISTLRSNKSTSKSLT